MVDPEIFSRRLAALRGYLAKLVTLKGTTAEEEFQRTPALHDLAERYLHLAERVLGMPSNRSSEISKRSPGAAGKLD